MFYRVLDFIIFFTICAFCFCVSIFRDFVNLSVEEYSSGWSARLARHPTIIFITVRDCEEQEEGSRLVLSGLHNAIRLPPFSISRSKVADVYVC